MINLLTYRKHIFPGFIVDGVRSKFRLGWATALLLMVFTLNAFGQGEISLDNNIGTWIDNATWTDGTAPAATGISDSITINGYVTLNGNLSTANGSELTITINDTLVVRGDFTLGNKTKLVLGENAILLVDGNYSSGSQVEVGNDGKIIVTGTVNISDSAQTEFDNTEGSLYVFDLAGSDFSKETDAQDSALEEGDMVGTDPGLWNFYQETTDPCFGLPVLSFTPLADVYENDAAFDLTEASPAGGIYSGSGITVSPEFDPSVAGVGTHTITYTYTDIDGCTGDTAQDINVLADVPKTFYSYQSGFWDQPSTWTFDPGGTTGPGTEIPGDNDEVVILSGRTVTLQADVTNQNLAIVINDGGVLDLSNFQFTNSLASLSGSGILKLATDAFPQATVNSFVNTDGGTTEYNVDGPISSTQPVYYHLTINTSGTARQVSDVSLNGDLRVTQGVFQINDATSRRLELIVNGNLLVDNAGSIAVGTGTTNSQSSPQGIDGATGGFLNYYELQSHRVQLFGDFTNNGVVRFTNLNYPVYDQLAGNGFATVYFQGSGDNVVRCNGQTDFYNIIIDKGTDQTFNLRINSTAYTNFRLFGANTSPGSTTSPAASASNPNLRKSLWIKNGTLVLEGLLAIPSLTEGNTGGGNGALRSDFIIPANGALQMNGEGVIVLSTADDYTEVNAAYGLAGGSNAQYGILTSGGASGLSVFGKFQMDNGYLSTRESSGILYWSYASGQFILNGGTIDAKQFHNPERGSNGLLSFSQSGGELKLRGRFQNTINYTNPADIAGPSINTARATNGIDTNGAIGTFNMNDNAGSAFIMSGGTISVHDVCNTSATASAININCAVSNTNVSGGNVQVIPTTGTGQADANYFINSTTSLYNFIVNRTGGSSSVQLTNNNLVLLNDLILTSGDLVANNLDVSVGGDFTIEAAASYLSGSNTTLFNGTGPQLFTVNIASPLSLNNLTIDKPDGSDFSFDGSQTVINVNANLELHLGNMLDNGNTVNVLGNVYNSGVHSGAGKIALNGTSLQTIDGNGEFGNLELNNTNAAAAPVSLVANTTVNGNLTFSRDKLLNLDTYNLTLGASASVINGGALRYFQTAGNVGDGGLTKIYSTPSDFIFPVGVNNYTPATIGLSADPASYGSITVTPVNFEHPIVTETGRSLTYYWRVKSSGFSLGSATVTHAYVYDQSNVVAGADITEDEYVAARFDNATSSWTSGTALDVDEGSNTIGEPGSGSFLENTSFIDGDYTAGDNNPTTPFGVPRIFYSRINGGGAGSGWWGNANTWSFDSNTGPANTGGAVPGGGDIVVIAGLDSVFLNSNLTTADTDVRSCASLKIERGSALDIGYNPGSDFTVVLSHENGNGNFRLTCDRGPLQWWTVRTFQFPSGDFSDFNQNFGTTELYTTNPVAGTTFYLPNGITSFGTLIISPLGGSNIIFPNNDLLIYGDAITRGQNADSWFCPAWNTPYPTAPTVTVAKTITVNGNLHIQGGGFIWYGHENIAQDLVVHGDVIVETLSAMYVWSNATNQSISIGGSLVNNTDGLRHGLSTRSQVDFSLVPTTFFGNSSAFITNTAGTPLTRFNQVTINKGNSQATTLTVDIGGTLNTETNNWLTLQNGTLIYNRTNPGSDFTISTTTPFTIPATAGLTVDLPSNTGNRNILIGNSNNNNGDLLLGGNLTLINGNVFIGRIAGTDNRNNDIEYTGSGTSTIDIRGGNLMVNGQIRRNPLNTGGILKYSQSGGSVTINGQNANSTNAKFEVLNSSSEFYMSGGTLTIVRGNGANTSPSSPVGDLYIRPESGAMTGGSIIFAHTGIATPQNYYLDATIPLYDLTITGESAANYSELRLLTSPLSVDGDMTINANSVLNANNIDVTFYGNLVNTPGVSGYLYGTNTTTFSATAAGSVGGNQSITGATDFYDLIVNPASTLSLSDPSTVNNDLVLNSGSLVCADNPVTLLGDLINDASYTDDDSPGSGIILAGTALQRIQGFGAYGRLTINNVAGVQIENDITLQEDLTMTNGILDIKKNLLTLGVNCEIQGAPFSASKMITSDGVFSNVGVRKFFNAGPISFLYPIGTSGKYTPAQVTFSASNTVGFLRINNIRGLHPSVLDTLNALHYYWEAESSGLTGVDGTLVLNYQQEDVFGDEPNYLSARLMVPGTSWSKTMGVDDAANTATFNYTGSNDLSGEYSAGIDTAFPDNIPEYTSNSDGSWTDKTIWDQTGGDPFPVPDGGPNGFVVNIDHVVSIDANNCAAYKTVINNELRILSPYYGHNLGTVSGSGKLYLERGSFPAGVFTDFLTCSNNASIEYGGTGTYTIINDLFTSIPNIIFSGTGARILPNDDLTVCRRLVIDGPILDNSV